MGGGRDNVTSCSSLFCRPSVVSSSVCCSGAHTSLPRCTHRRQGTLVLNLRNGRTSHVFDSPSLQARGGVAALKQRPRLDRRPKTLVIEPPARARAHDDADDEGGRRQWYGSHGRIALARLPLGGVFPYCLVRGFALPQGPGRLSRCSRWPLRPLSLPNRPFQPLSFVGASLVAGSDKVEGTSGEDGRAVGGDTVRVRVCR